MTTPSIPYRLRERAAQFKADFVSPGDAALMIAAAERIEALEAEYTLLIQQLEEAHNA